MIKKITIAIVMAVLCLNFRAIAQIKSDVLMPVKIGEQVPNEIWDMPMQIYKSGKYITETLRQYRGNVIVFDFWASWCGNCIEGFPKLSKLQDSVPDGLKIILVNAKEVHDTNQAIEKVFINHKDKLGSLPTIIQDTILHKLFSTYALPSYVVVGGDADLMGVTLSYMFHEEDIKTMVLQWKRLLEIRRKIKEGRGGK